MGLKVTIGYWHILGLISQLSRSDKERLAMELNSDIEEKQPVEPLQDLILNAPTWTDEEWNNFRRVREYMNNSRIA